MIPWVILENDLKDPCFLGISGIGMAVASAVASAPASRFKDPALELFHEIEKKDQKYQKIPL